MKVPEVPPALQFVFLFVTVFSISSWAQSSQGRKLLLANPSSESFGTVQVGSSKTVTETVTNSGSQSITISQISANGSAFKVNCTCFFRNRVERNVGSALIDTN